MNRAIAIGLAIAFASAIAGSAQVDVNRVVDDAKAVDRVAEMSHRDFPRDVMKRIVTEDIELLRGRRSDGSYQYANYDRLEASRISDTFSLEPSKGDDLKKLEMKGDHVYRIILDSPVRRLLVTKNRHVFVDRIEVEFIAEGSSQAKSTSFKINDWIEPGTLKPVDLPDIARQATVRVYGRADKEAGYGNLGISLVQAKIFDVPESPYANAVANEKSLLHAVENGDASNARNIAARVLGDLPGSRVAGTAATQTLEVNAAPPVPVVAPSPSSSTIPQVEIYVELQAIEDLLTGNDAERRDGLDKLHQLIRQLRPAR